MSSSGVPRKRPSRRVYRRRRLVVLVVLLLVVVFVVALIVHAAGSKGAPAADPSAGHPGSHATDQARPGATATAVSSPQPTSGQPALCESTEVTVTAITSATSYAATAEPELPLSVENHGSAPCRINVGTSQQVFVITGASGSQVYWKSTDCQTGATNSEVTLSPGQKLTSGTPLAWDREASDPATCGGARSAVPAGGAAYALQTTVDGITSTNVAKFTLN